MKLEKVERSSNFIVSDGHAWVTIPVLIMIAQRQLCVENGDPGVAVSCCVKEQRKFVLPGSSVCVVITSHTP